GDGRRAEVRGELLGVLPHLREEARAALRELLCGFAGGLLPVRLAFGLAHLFRYLLRGGAVGFLHGGATLPPGRLAVPLADPAVLVEVPHAGAGQRGEGSTERGRRVERVEPVDDV